jgi:phage terminase small subunit
MCYAGGRKTNAPNKTQYREMSEAVVTVASELKITPRATQALIWIIFRGSAE